jgi:hypothetical protein
MQPASEDVLANLASYIDPAKKRDVKNTPVKRPLFAKKDTKKPVERKPSPVRVVPRESPVRKVAPKVRHPGSKGSCPDGYHTTKTKDTAATSSIRGDQAFSSQALGGGSDSRS